MWPDYTVTTLNLSFFSKFYLILPGCTYGFISATVMHSHQKINVCGTRAFSACVCVCVFRLFIWLQANHVSLNEYNIKFYL